MAQAIALARTHFAPARLAEEMARVAIVCGSAVALVAAGPFLPL